MDLEEATSDDFQSDANETDDYDDVLENVERTLTFPRITLLMNVHFAYVDPMYMYNQWEKPSDVVAIEL